MRTEPDLLRAPSHHHPGIAVLARKASTHFVRGPSLQAARADAGRAMRGDGSGGQGLRDTSIWAGAQGKPLAQGLTKGQGHDRGSGAAVWLGCV